MHEHAALDTGDQCVLLPSAHALCAPHLRTTASMTRPMRCCTFAYDKQRYLAKVMQHFQAEMQSMN